MNLAEYISEQNHNRKLWENHDSPDKLAGMITAESQELEEAIQESLVTGDVFSVVSEIGDVGYLLQRLCNELGINLEDAINLKLTRNSMKYSDHVMSNGRTYDQAVGVSKEYWKAMGGDYAFSHAYLNYLAKDE